MPQGCENWPECAVGSDDDSDDDGDNSAGLQTCNGGCGNTYCDNCIDCWMDDNGQGDYCPGCRRFVCGACCLYVAGDNLDVEDPADDEKQHLINTGRERTRLGVKVEVWRAQCRRCAPAAWEAAQRERDEPIIWGP